MTSKKFKRVVLASVQSALQNEETYLDAISDTDMAREPTVQFIKDLKELRALIQTHNVILTPQ